MPVNVQYNSNNYSNARPESMADRAAWKVRQKIFQKLESLVSFESLDSVLDVGVTSDRNFVSSNFFEEFFPRKDKITALSDQDASWLEEIYPGLKFIQGNACAMPFESSSFDLVFSSAVVEHVGSADNQRAFVAECCRVARRHVFITTPNRWHPLELHTALPFLHWLPKPTHRRILKALGLGELALEANLNLLDRTELQRICQDLGFEKIQIFSVNFLGFPSNLLLYIKIAS